MKDRAKKYIESQYDEGKIKKWKPEMVEAISSFMAGFSNQEKKKYEALVRLTNAEEFEALEKENKELKKQIKMTEKEIHLKLSEVVIDNDNLDYIKSTGEICGKLRWDLVKLFAIPDVR